MMFMNGLKPDAEKWYGHYIGKIPAFTYGWASCQPIRKYVIHVKSSLIGLEIIQPQKLNLWLERDSITIVNDEYRVFH